jgi:hypothetical protein
LHFFIITIVILLTTFIFTLYIAPYHIYGDQEHYTEAYNSIKNLSLLDAWNTYTSVIYTGEPIHFFITWVTSSLGIDKNVIMGISNSILAVLYAKYLYNKNFNLLLICLIFISNYYLLTMFFTLERTKFAFIFFLLGLLYRSKIFIFISVFTHSIMLFPIFANLTSKYLNFKKTLKSPLTNQSKSKNNRIKTLGLFLVLYLIYFYLGQHLLSKFNSYAFNGFEIYQILIIFLLSYITAISKSEVLVFFFVIIVSIVILGGDRLNMLGYFAFLHFGDLKKPLFTKITFLLILYYLIKSIIYINMIITIGG